VATCRRVCGLRPIGVQSRPSVMGVALAAALSFLGAGCTEGSRPGADSTGAAGVPVRPLSGSTFASDSLMGWIFDLDVVGNRLVALDAFSEPALHIFDRRSHERTGSFGSKGEGPREFMAPWSLVQTPGLSSGEVRIFDFTLKRLTILDLAEIERGFPGQPETRRLETPSIISLVRTRDGTWLSSGHITNGMIGRLDSDLIFEKAIVGFPPGTPELPMLALQQGYQMGLAVHPNEDRVVGATRHGGLLNIYDHSGTLLAEAQGPDRFDPVVLVGRARDGRAVFTMGPESRTGYVDVEATARFIYGLFSGLREDEAPDDRFYGTEIHVFTWDGNLVEILTLPRRAGAIAVDDDDQVIYASGLNPAPWISESPLGL